MSTLDLIIIKVEIVGESLSSAAVCSLGLLLLLQDTFPLRGISKPLLFHHVFCVTFHKAGALAWPWASTLEAGGVHSSMAPGEGPRFFRRSSPPPLLYYSPLANLHLAFYYVLEVYTRALGELPGESDKQWDLTTTPANDYHLGSNLLTLCVLDA